MKNAAFVGLRKICIQSICGKRVECKVSRRGVAATHATVIAHGHKHTHSSLRYFIAQSILISWSIRDNISAPPSFSHSPDGVIEGCKEEDVSVGGLLP